MKNVVKKGKSIIVKIMKTECDEVQKCQDIKKEEPNLLVKVNMAK